MKRLVSAVTAIVCLIILTTACGDKKFKDYKKTDSGLYYKFIVENPDAQQPKEGDVLVAELKYRYEDSVLFENMGNPQRVFQVMPSDFKGDINEGLKMMHVGDEAVFAINADSMSNLGIPMPPYFKAGANEYFYFEVKLHSIVSKAEIDKELAEKEAKIELAKNSEQDSINAYITRNNIKRKPTESGLYYIETKAGTGAKVDTGKTITINYTGKLLDGTVFDSSLGEGREPMEFVLQDGMMIKGFTEGLLLMKEKGKATLLIPSSLAYGPGNPQSPIPPYSPLIFEIEILSVK